MSRHGNHRAWDEDPANAVVAELYADISRDLGTDGPADTFGHPVEGRLGHLVEDDRGMGSHDDRDYLGTDSGDLEDLSAEEQAMHVMTDVELDEQLDPDISPGAFAALTDPR